MSTPAIEAIQNPNTSTGPVTAAGKAIASQNALKDGLWSARDFIRPGEESDYAQTRDAFMRDLSPAGALEELFANEIVTAHWRLRRCGLIESALAFRADELFALNETDEKRQKSADRARAQSHNIIRRCIAELRKLQTDRQIRMELETEENCGLADTKNVMLAMKLHASLPGLVDTIEPAASEEEDDNEPETEESLREFNEMLERELHLPPSSFCKSAPGVQAVSTKVPRNLPCPCGSGIKYKKCCGGCAAPAQNRAAPALNRA